MDQSPCLKTEVCEISGSPIEIRPQPAQEPATFAVLAVAKVCHEANKSFCETLCDYSQPDWAGAAAWQKESAMQGVKKHYHDRGMSPADSHDCWMAQKIADGWKYGPVKDPGKKEHPCLVPYAELPTETKAKDYLFRAIVHAFIDAGLL